MDIFFGKNKHMKCDYCKTEAVINYQKVWSKFKIDKSGIYKKIRAFDALDIEEPIENDNIHLCQRHEKV